MFQRLFGKKKTEEPTGSASTEATDKQMESTERAARAKATIEKNIADLQKKINILNDKLAKDTAQAKALRAANKGVDDPEMKALLIRIRDYKKKIGNYQSTITKQEESLGSIEDAAFIEEMQAILASTNAVLASCAANADSIADLMDQIAEHRDRIQEAMDTLTQPTETDGLDDLLGELDEEIKNDQMKAPSQPLPQVPQSLPQVPQSLPQVPQAKGYNDADLTAELDNLSFVCYQTARTLIGSYNMLNHHSCHNKHTAITIKRLK